MKTIKEVAMKTGIRPVSVLVRSMRRMVRLGLLERVGKTNTYRVPPDVAEALEEVPEFLNDFEAVFNCHINGAKRKAKAAFIAKFGRAVWNEKLADADKNGIMVIFKSSPTKWTKFYVGTVAKIVNEGRAKRRTRAPR